MAIPLPGARGLFSALQDALHKSDRRVFNSLADFRALADSIRSRLTRLLKLVPVGAPVAFGACDACHHGMGGAWFRPNARPSSGEHLSNRPFRPG